MKQLIATLAGTADGALLMDRDGKVAFWNRAAERLLGFRADEVLGRPCHEVMRGDTLEGQPLCSAACAVGGRIARGGVVHNFDMQARTKAGRAIWLNVSSLPIPTRKRDRFWAAHLFRDITRQAKVRQLVDELHIALCDGGAGGLDTPPDSLPEIPVALPLSDRERQVLRLLASGENTQSIADSLCISRKTVRNHIQHILQKLGAHTRLQAFAIAFPPGVRSS